MLSIRMDTRSPLDRAVAETSPQFIRATNDAIKQCILDGYRGWLDARLLIEGLTVCMQFVRRKEGPPTWATCYSYDLREVPLTLTIAST